MAFTNTNTRSTTTGSIDVRGDSKAQPCMRASFRPQSFVLAEDETAYLQWGEVIADDILRTFIVTLKEDDDAAILSNHQTAILSIHKGVVKVMPILHLDATSAIITDDGDNVTTAPANNTLEFGYDADGDPDGNPLYYMASGFQNGDVLVSIVRIDGHTEDLHTLVN